MKTDFTIFGRTRNHENVNKLVAGIEAKGYTCFNFLSKPVLPEYAHLSWEEQMEKFEATEDFWNDPMHQHHFETDMQALRDAEKTILLLPAGKAAHMEAGVAYGMNKPLIIIGTVENPETLYLMANEHYDTIEDFLQTV